MHLMLALFTCHTGCIGGSLNWNEGLNRRLAGLHKCHCQLYRNKLFKYGVKMYLAHYAWMESEVNVELELLETASFTQSRSGKAWKKPRAKYLNFFVFLPGKLQLPIQLSQHHLVESRPSFRPSFLALWCWDCGKKLSDPEISPNKTKQKKRL